MADRNTCYLRVTYSEDTARALIENYVKDQGLEWTIEDVTKGVVRLVASLGDITPARLDALRKLEDVRDVELSYATA